MDLRWKERALRTLRKNPAILKAVLHGVDQERAQTARDGADGWTVLEVVCHLRDVESVFFERARLALETDLPEWPMIDQIALVTTNRYAEQNLAEAFQGYVQTRQEFVYWLEALSDEAWLRRGIHFDLGEISILELVVNYTLHDVNHIEQIARALELTDALIT
jgi:hypothetical protein